MLSFHPKETQHLNSCLGVRILPKPNSQSKTVWEHPKLLLTGKKGPGDHANWLDHVKVTKADTSAYRQI